MITHWLEHPESMGAEAVAKLPELIEHFPYCPTYKVLYCIALANTHSTLLNEELQRTACALPDRTQLFLLVNNGEHEWVELMHQLEQLRLEEIQSDSDEDNFALIDQYLSQQHLPAMEIEGLMPEVPADYLLTSIDDEKDATISSAHQDEQDALIDQFLSVDNEGELLVPKPEPSIEDAPTPEPDLIREKAFLTESLAKLYVKQHKFEQALAIFSQLNLQYSKKSSNFADQIRYLEKIIATQKEVKSTLESQKKNK